MESTKKKTALLFAYNGSAYNGSQIQNNHENIRTIEAELESALFKSRCISQENFGFLSKIKWSRASRTDKGVHALCSVVALKMIWETRPYEDIMAEINSNLPNDIRIISMKLVAASFNAKKSCSYREYNYLFPYKALNSTEEYDDAVIKKINTITNLFHGTHSFHNYSRDVKPNTPEAKRYIVKFELNGNRLVYENLYYLTFIITGQSFLYHQIRKMIGMCLAVYNEKMSVEDLRKSFEPENFDVPLAPAEGLLLNKVFYSVYNQKQKHRPIIISKEEDLLIENFYTNSILPTIHSAYNVFETWTTTELK